MFRINPQAAQKNKIPLIGSKSHINKKLKTSYFYTRFDVELSIVKDFLIFLIKFKTDFNQSQKYTSLFKL